MANLVEHTMLNGLEENLKNAIEMAGGEIPADSCVWDYPGIIRDQLSSGGQVIKILPGKGIQVERDSKGNYIVSVENADTSDNIEINTIQAPSFAVGVEGGQWDKGTVLQDFLEDLFSKVFPYVPSVKGGEIIEADEEGNDIFGYDETTGNPLVTNGLDRGNQYIRLSLASQIEPVYISLENLKTNADNIDLSKYYTKEEIDNKIASSIDKVTQDITTKLETDYYTKEEIKTAFKKLDTSIDQLHNDLDEVKLNLASNYYDKTEVDELVDSKIAEIPDVDLSGYYTKDEVYNKSEVDSLIDSKIADIPETDLSNYYTKSETDSAINSTIENFQIQTTPESEPVKIVDAVVEVTEKVNQQQTQISHIIEQINNIDAADYNDSEPVFNEIFNGKTEAITVTSKDELLSMINEGHVELASNIDLVDTPLIIEGDVEVNLGGNDIVGGVFTESGGSILEGSSDSYAFMAIEGSNLTISGEGNVIAQDATYSMAVWANGGTVTINGGVFKNGGDSCDLIYASNGGRVYIYGGEFIATDKKGVEPGTNNTNSALNIRDSQRDICQILVYGGKFYRFDPGNNLSEGPGTSFLAPGYKSVQDGDYFVVVKE